MIRVLVLALLATCVVAPPVEKKKAGPGKETNEINEKHGAEEPYPDGALLYNRYLKEVVSLLESDDEFKKKLEGAKEDDIRSGKIAKELEFVSHHVRSSLDEMKRQELERLRHAAIEEYERGKGVDKRKLKIPSHIDHKNPHTFEIEDLRKLIIQTTRDLEEMDRKRREEFKQYEIEKEYDRNEKLKSMDEEHKKEAQRQYDEMQKKHNNHPQMHHPGSKQQLEQVWEEQDHMSPEDFNPKTFFFMHDLDGNGYWDTNEVKALFKKELDKVYDPNAPEDDINERMEEMERMREHVFNETDLDRDSLISLHEFMEQTRRSDFQQDPGWDTVDQQTQYSQQEYQQFELRRQEEIQRMIEQGLLQHPQMYGGAPMMVPAHGAPINQGYQGQQQHHPGGYQAQHTGQGYQAQHPQQMQGHQAQHPQQLQGNQAQHPQQLQGHQAQHPQQMQGHQAQQLPTAHGYQAQHPQQMQGHQVQHPQQLQGHQAQHPQQLQGHQAQQLQHPQGHQAQQGKHIPPPPVPNQHAQQQFQQQQHQQFQQQQQQQQYNAGQQQQYNPGQQQQYNPGQQQQNPGQQQYNAGQQHNPGQQQFNSGQQEHNNPGQQEHNNPGQQEHNNPGQQDQNPGQQNQPNSGQQQQHVVGPDDTHYSSTGAPPDPNHPETNQV